VTLRTPTLALNTQRKPKLNSIGGVAPCAMKARTRFYARGNPAMGAETELPHTSLPLPLWGIAVQRGLYSMFQPWV
jgi:hypothetical protein